MGLSGDWGTWVYRALTFLVISCPCALVISIPLSFFAGLGGASRAGVLVKGSNYLETLSKTRVVVFDKTGTLTQGVFDVTGVHHNTMPQKKVLEYAALAECASSHPISKSLQRAYGGEIDRHRVTDVQEISGNGITAKVDGTDVAVGNSKLMDRLGIAWHDCHSVGTIIHLAIGGQYAGHIVISDVVKPHAKEAIAALKQAGVEKTVMLTGDIRRVADHVAGELCVDEVHSELLPADKVAQVERLLNSSDGKLAFVGDGINDAPVLSRADIGIAMGAMGSDAAIEAADVVSADRVREHRVCAGCQGPVSGTGRCGHRQYVGGHLCRRGCHGHRRAECHPRPTGEEFMTAKGTSGYPDVPFTYVKGFSAPSGTNGPSRPSDNTAETPRS